MPCSVDAYLFIFSHILTKSCLVNGITISLLFSIISSTCELSASSYLAVSTSLPPNVEAYSCCSSRGTRSKFTGFFIRSCRSFESWLTCDLRSELDFFSDKLLLRESETELLT
jgi:hypothetical protein